jgi:inositol oxygenase
MYEQGCGLDKLNLAWGHDEYLYQVLSHHKANKLPGDALIMIRYHSFYPWHTGGSYTELLQEKDQDYLEIIRDFNRYDLYTKSDIMFELEEVKAYYQPIAEKYLGKGPIYW